MTKTYTTHDVDQKIRFLSSATKFHGTKFPVKIFSLYVAKVHHQHTSGTVQRKQ